MSPLQDPSLFGVEVQLHAGQQTGAVFVQICYEKILSWKITKQER
jgi:hypothetical protein